MPPPIAGKILVVGGYGAFGARAAERLARYDDLEVVIAGRSLPKARAAAEVVARSAGRDVAAMAIDAQRPDPAALEKLSPGVVINASGPFQAQDYALAEAAIAVGAHYVDLADARRFVTGIGALDGPATEAGVLVTSGASSVPALAAAIVDHHLPAFSRLDVIEHGITPANGYDPGQATTASILGGLGRPMPMLIDGDWRVVHGWLGLRRVAIPGLGHRLMANCDVPDLVLFPQRYSGVRTVRFLAGLEVPLFQLSLWVLAGAARRGLLKQPERLAGLLMAMKHRLSFLGGDAGGMVVRLSGLSREGIPLTRIVSLIARDNKGPYVPVVAAVAIARKLARGEIVVRGARPCLGLMTLEDLVAEVADLPIEIMTQQSP